MSDITQDEFFRRDVSIKRINIGNSSLWSIVERLLPPQGCIEVQHDASGKEHSWHHHNNDETLVIINGGIHFYWNDNEKFCESGDVISLPSGIRHKSVAIENGAVYLIVFQHIDLHSYV